MKRQSKIVLYISIFAILFGSIFQTFAFAAGPDNMGDGNISHNKNRALNIESRKLSRRIAGLDPAISKISLAGGNEFNHGDITTFRLDFNDSAMGSGFKAGDVISYDFPSGYGYSMTFAAGVTRYMDLTFQGEKIGVAKITKDGVQITFNENVSKFDKETVEGFVQFDVRLSNDTEEDQTFKVGEEDIKVNKKEKSGTGEDVNDSYGVLYKTSPGERLFQNGHKFVNGLEDGANPEDPTRLAWMYNMDFRNKGGTNFAGEDISYHIEDKLAEQGLKYIKGSFEVEAVCNDPDGNEERNIFYTDNKNIENIEIDGKEVKHLDELKKDFNIEVSLSEGRIIIDIPKGSLGNKEVMMFFQTEVDPDAGEEAGDKTFYKNSIDIIKDGDEKLEGSHTITDYNMASGISGDFDVEYGQILIAKSLDSEGLEIPLKGAKFALYKITDKDKKDFVTQGITNEDGLLLLGASSKIEPGKYELVETGAPGIAKLLDKPIKLEVDDLWHLWLGDKDTGVDLSEENYYFEGKEYKNTVEVKNESKGTRDLEITKEWLIDGETDIEAVEVRLGLYKLDGKKETKIKEIILNEENKWNHIEQGIINEEDVEYFVKEESFKIKDSKGKEYEVEKVGNKFPEEIEVNGKKYKLSVNEEGLKLKNELKNNEKLGSLEILKQDMNNNPLNGVEFELKGKDKTYKAKTDKAGRLVFKDLKVGEYQLRESKALAGYKNLEETIKVTIDSDGKTSVGETDSSYVEFKKDENILLVKNNEKVKIEIFKRWLGIEGTEVKFALYDGEELLDGNIILTEKDETFDPMVGHFWYRDLGEYPKYREDGSEADYEIKEISFKENLKEISEDDTVVKHEVEHLVEDLPDGYSSEKVDITKGENETEKVSYDFINQKSEPISPGPVEPEDPEPEEPTKPVEPEDPEPEEPTKPVEPENPETEEPTKPVEPEMDNKEEVNNLLPKTGVKDQLTIKIIGLILLGLALYVLNKSRK